jgi:hypothetical protein
MTDIAQEIIEIIETEDDVIKMIWLLLIELWLKQSHFGQNSEYRSYYPGAGLRSALFI